MKKIIVALLLCAPLLFADSDLPRHVEGLSTESEKRKTAVEDFLRFKYLEDVQLSPDGKRIAFTVGEYRARKTKEDVAWEWTTGVWVVSPDEDRPPRRLTGKKGLDNTPRWSPDGRFLAFLSASSSAKGKDEISQIRLIKAAGRGGRARWLTHRKHGVSEFSWSHDGQKIAFIAEDPTDEEKEYMEKMDPIVLTRRQHKQDGEGFLTTVKSRLFVVDVEGGEPERLTEGPYDDSEPQFSPDGTRIAFVSNRTEEPDSNYNDDIWIISLEDKSIKQITTSTGTEWAPRWSPDGARIAYAHTDSHLSYYKQVDVMVIPAEGGGPLNLTKDLDRTLDEDSLPAWSADGEYLYFTVVDEGAVPLLRVPSEGGEAERLVEGPRCVASLSAARNAGRIAFLLEDPQHPPEVHTAAPDGSDIRKHTGFNQDLLDELVLSPYENIRFENSVGQAIEGWLVKPPDFDPAKKYPVILKIHGGPAWFYGHNFTHDFQLYAARGYVLLIINYRGSTGYGEAFTEALIRKWGAIEFDDLMSGVDYVLETRDYADPGRLGVTGMSWGGILTNWIVGHTDRFAAAVSENGDSDYSSAFGTDEWQRDYIAELGAPWENPELYRKLSPITYVENMKTPILFIHGQEDWNCPLAQIEQLYVSLKVLGRAETKMIIYPREAHGIEEPKHLTDYWKRVFDWFDGYLMPEEEEGEEETEGGG
jgi:dipeptidyl aminopeptidase/acylaminoacyl peptidase